ncbi:MAG: sigma-70 family RNA polymerase sigma factor [Planctomycetes bacterium]|nr:sigma-70 family RNA polymerase sigma factor [Planctomycetota bacterium]
MIAVRTAPADLEQALHRYVADGDDAAFQTVLTAYHRLVRAVCARILDDPAAVDDAVQETFIRFSRHAASVRVNLGSWMYQTATNAALSLRKSELARRRREHAYGAERDDEVPFEHPPGEYEFILEQCLAELVPSDRQLIVAYFFRGRTQRQLAAEAGVSQPAIKKRIDRSLVSLRFKLLRRGLGLQGGSEPTSAACLAFAPIDRCSVVLAAVVFGVLVIAALAGRRWAAADRSMGALLRLANMIAALLWLVRWPPTRNRFRFPPSQLQVAARRIGEVCLMPV